MSITDRTFWSSCWPSRLQNRWVGEVRGTEARAGCRGIRRRAPKPPQKHKFRPVGVTRDRGTYSVEHVPHAIPHPFEYSSSSDRSPHHAPSGLISKRGARCSDLPGTVARTRRIPLKPVLLCFYAAVRLRPRRRPAGTPRPSPRATLRSWDRAARSNRAPWPT